MRKRVVITGLGVVSSIGIGWQEFWKNLLAGKSGISPVTSIDTSKHFTHKGGEVKNFDTDALLTSGCSRSLSRASQMAVVAARLALSDAGLSADVLLEHVLGISHGTTMGAIHEIEAIDERLVAACVPELSACMKLPPYSVAAVLARAFNATGPNHMFTTACAAGNYAIAYGYDLISSGRADIVVAGASDPFSRIEFTGFNQFSAVAPEKCQPFDKNRKGMMLGEGAGILILESLEVSERRGLKPYAEVLGYGLSCDAYHMTSASWQGISACMRNALKSASLAPENIDYISAHGTGTVANDRAECAAIRDVFGERYRRIPISSIKSMIGHTMGAASAIEAVACALSIKHGVLPPTINYDTSDPECDIDCVPNTARSQPVQVAMNNSYAFGGNNASVVMKMLS